MATTKTTSDNETKKTVKTTTKKAEPAKKATAAKKPASKTATAKKATTTKKPAATKATDKKTVKKAASKKAEPAKKATAAKKTTKAASKKAEPVKKTTTVSTKTTGFKIEQKHNEGSLLDILGAPSTPPIPASKSKTSKTSTAKKETTKKAEVKTKKPAGPTRPLHKPRTFTKEEKVLYKRLEEAFNYVANLTMVIEERTIDSNAINDLTLSELHVLEVVNKEASIPMTKVANQLKITVGSLTTCVNRLVKKEYLFRERDEVDHRIIKVSTTQKAKKALKVHDLFHEQILLGVLDGVTIRDATKVMAQFVRTLENYINPKEKNYENPIDTKKKKNI